MVQPRIYLYALIPAKFKPRHTWNTNNFNSSNNHNHNMVEKAMVIMGAIMVITRKVTIIIIDPEEPKVDNQNELIIITIKQP